MRYELRFVPEAHEEWPGLDGSVKAPFKSALQKRLVTPRMPGAERRSPFIDGYKIRLRGIGYRLLYLVRDCENPPDIVVLTVGRHDGGIYEAAAASWEEGRTLEGD